MDYERWCSLTDDELARLDVALVNLTAAQGLPGSENLDIDACLQRLDEWAECVRKKIEAAWHLRTGPQHCHLTENQFRILVMVTVLQRDLGVHYNPACMTGDFDARDTRDHFIHGPLCGHGGTCASLPVLYVAIGRRLDFPLFLSHTLEHLFVRWQGRGERFNIEATCRGFGPRDDDYYRSFPHRIGENWIQQYGFLKNLAPRQVMGTFLDQGGKCWGDHLLLGQAVRASYFAKECWEFYQGNWRVTSMMHRLLNRIISMDHSIPWESRVQLASPLPNNPSEAWCLYHAQQNLLRVFRIWHTQNGHGFEVPELFSFQPADKEPVNV